MCASCGKTGHCKKVCQSRKDCTFHAVGMELEEGGIEEVSINSVYLNNKWSLLTAQLETQVGGNATKVPYKIGTGSEGNLMSLYIFKKLFRNESIEQLRSSIKSNIRLKTYNGMQIEQLGMCTVTIKFKNFINQCVFFVVPGNSQVLLGMQDMAVLNIINLNIDSIQKEIRNCKTNRDTHSAAKQDDNGQQHQSQANKLINYFYSSSNTGADKIKSINMTKRVHEEFSSMFNGIGCFACTFSLQLKPDSKPYQAPPRCIAYALQKPFKEELEHLQELDITVPLGVDKMAEWCNSFVLVPKANGKVQLCLDPV